MVNFDDDKLKLLKDRTFCEGPWYSRGYLPHLDQALTTYFITFRLFDSLPQKKILELMNSISLIDKPEYKVKMQKKIEDWIDQGYGACYLKNEKIATMVQTELLNLDNNLFNLHAWVIMPNHIHLLFTLLENNSLAEIMHVIKGRTARQANLILKRKGSFWGREYFDRFIRNQQHYGFVLNYIEYNPVVVGLCKNPHDWPFSSAARERRLQPACYKPVGS